MRILMLGWEFPPFISGGLGTACRGLTDALKRTDARVLFVLPRSIESAAATGDGTADFGATSRHVRYASVPSCSPGVRERVTVAAVASTLTDPYATHAAAPEETAAESERARRASSSVRVMGVGAEDGYEGDLVGKIQAYAERCVLLARREIFDVIHAHDWMTFPAAIAISELSARPMVAHVHATEFDRSSDPTHGTIYDIERRGMHAAARVLAVSRRTRDTIVQRYGVPPRKVTVVHNGIDDVPASPQRANGEHPTVLFLGRITRQKGPLFFVQAAARVAAHVPDARFVVAGTGDQLPETVALARELGIADRMDFVGFLRGAEVDRAYERASVYVMPSVSEPFGLTALEAAAHGVPVIVSRSSGVAEVLERGSLKVDHWDVELMARLIVAVLTNPPLAESLVRESRREILGADWDRAARRCVETYYQVTDPGGGAREALAVGVGAGA
jgi:glycosyltransferase involved in cell wall biosynthesis